MLKGWPSKVFVLLTSTIGGFLLAGTVTAAEVTPAAGAAAGLLVGLAAVALGAAAERAEAAALTGGFAGLVIGLAAAQLVGLALGSLVEATIRSYAIFFLSVVLGYLGLVAGRRRGLSLASALPRAAEQDEEEKRSDRYKILDTSVIIDGRIADICETGFLEGTFVIPQFVLRELQHIADSSDALKRNRGRRGLDVLHRLQKKVDLDIMIVETDFPRIREVDAKLIALAKQNGGKIITNDYNLNKVAELQGVTVLNINQLANALKPVVLPGETMKVYVLKEGKEANQGVAYLDDGTMVVVDNAKREIGKTIEVLVTSVLQTTAGRMIFTQIKEESRNGS